MSARKKLNAIYFSGATLFALAMGITTSSVMVFCVCFAVLTIALLHDGSIRPDQVKRKRRR